MDPNLVPIIRRMRDAELPRAMRGYQEQATEDLLRTAAFQLEQIANERDVVCRELDDARSSRDGEAAPNADVEAVGRALLTANSIGEEIVASAKERSERMVAEAEAEAEQLLAAAREKAEADKREFAGLQWEAERQRERLEAEREELLATARDEAERMLDAARAEVAWLREEADGLSSTIEEKRSAFIAIARSALEQLNELKARNSTSTQAADELLTALQPVETNGSAPGRTEAAEAAPED